MTAPVHVLLAAARRHHLAVHLPGPLVAADDPGVAAARATAHAVTAPGAPSRLRTLTTAAALSAAGLAVAAALVAGAVSEAVLRTIGRTA